MYNIIFIKKFIPREIKKKTWNQNVDNGSKKNKLRMDILLKTLA